MDKPIVEKIAEVLSRVFRQENVFYDSWSIQPGDEIIDKMNEGLKKCQFFFFFISHNSLTSNMVKLEWQNALMKENTSGMMRFIPVRIDDSALPDILLQKLYIDLFTNGLEIATRQIIDVVNGQKIYNPINSSVPNLRVYKYWHNKDLIIECHAIYYMEPIPDFAFITKNTEDEINFSAEAGMFRGGFGDFPVEGNTKVNACYMAFPEPITPHLQQIAIFKAKSESPIDIIAIFHLVGRNKWESIPVFNRPPSNL